MAGLLLLIPPMFVRMEQRTTQLATTTTIQRILVRTAQQTTQRAIITSVSMEVLSPTATQHRAASMVVLIQIAAPPPLSAKVLRPASQTR